MSLVDISRRCLMKYVTRYNKTHYVYKYIRRDLYEAFIKWCGEDSINICLEKALSILATNIGANVAGASSSASSSEALEPNVDVNIEPDNVQKNTVTKCIKKSKTRFPLESYINLFKHKGVFVDWWDDGDQVCFELKSEGMGEAL